MALVNYLKYTIFKEPLRILRYSTKVKQDDRLPPGVIEARETDLPVEMENPFAPPKPKCVLCEYDIEPEYKNVQLLSQFISRFTGRIHDRHITGLCELKQKKVVIEIRKAQAAGLMGYTFKDPKFYKDPSLYNPDKPIRPHKY